MNFAIEIFYHNNYRIHQKFHCRIPYLAGYLIKTLGIDCCDNIQKSEQKLAHKDSLYRGPNAKFLIVFKEYLRTKRRRKKLEYNEITDSV